MALDVVECDDLRCANCGSMEVRAECNDHGPQETAQVRHGHLHCMEWDYERGRECLKRLNVICKECNESEVEGLS